uniref:Uncharacterized protein n=1 Tax=Anguilla anguilla TaxID=7936 RepID=A0A0E9TWF3_ANGAN
MPQDTTDMSSKFVQNVPEYSCDKFSV